MADTQNSPVRGQDNSYRRGLLLGLTMAEIMLLILFMLLLALGVAITDRETELKDTKEKLVGYQAVEKFLSEMAAQPSSISVTDIVQRIERQNHSIASLTAEVEKLHQYASAGKAIDDIVKEINRGGGAKVSPAEIIKRLAEVEKTKSENSNLKGQITQLTNQIKAAGKGNEFPSCWVTPDGKTQSIFELTLGASGISIREHAVPDKAAERAALPIQSIPYGRDLGAQEFVSAVTPLYNWSVAHNCRFYVIRYSSLGTAPIDAINRISSMFYPDSNIMRADGVR